MSPERHQKVKALFDDARRRPADERPALLRERCGDDEAVRLEVESLLAAHEGDPEFMNEPAMGRGFELEAARRASEESTTEIPMRIGRYDIVRVLGEGGMGTVYEAQQKSPHRRVALKVIRGSIIPGRLQRRFAREAELLGRLKHPGIAQVYEAGSGEVIAADGTSRGAEPFFAMELVDGIALDQFAQTNDLDTRSRLQLFVKVCDAVQYAHQNNVIHRDLKPGNILVNNREEVKILDFGVARTTDSDVRLTTLHTDMGQLLGTVPYMSPEQVRGDPAEIDIRSDIYALGVILYKLLADQLPYDVHQKSIPEAARIICDQDPSRLSTISRSYRGDLETIVNHAMRKEPQERYQSAGELAADIRRHLSHEPIAARPASTLYQLRKFARRNKAIVAGVMAVMLISIIGTIISLNYAVRESAARKDAQERTHELQERTRELQVRTGELQGRTRELKEVTQFQAAMLREIDAEIMGREIVADLRERARTQLGERGLDGQATATALAGFDEAVTGVNATDLALKVVDERILRRAVETIDTDFADQPVIRAALHSTAAETYEEIGLFEPALSLQQRALATRREELGDDHPDTLASMRGLSRLYRRTGQLDAARPLMDESIERHRRVLGDDDPMTLNALTQKGLLLTDTGPVDEAERILRSVLESCRRMFGEEDPSTAAAAGALGALLSSTNRYEEAETLKRAQLAVLQETLGEHHPDTLASMLSLADVLTHMSQFEDAMSLYEQALERLESRLGLNHPRTVGVLINLGTLSLHMGDREKAEEHLREVAARYAEVMGTAHPSTLDALTNLAWLLSFQGRHEEAAEYYREAYEGYRRTMGADAPETLGRMNSLASVLHRLGQHDEAARLCAEAIKRGRRSYPPGDWRLGRDLHGLGRTLIDLHRYAEAEAALEEALTVFEAGSEDQRWRVGGVTNALVDLYTAWDEVDPGMGYDIKVDEWRAKLPPKRSFRQPDE